MASEAFEAALARLGVRDSEVICLKSLRVPAQVNLSRTDAALSAALIEALVSGLADAITRSDGLVRYASRAQALVDLLIAVGRGDLSRAWAWRQLGLWSGSVEAPGKGAAAAMMKMPETVSAALVEVARAGALAGLVAQIPAGEWTAIARAALATAGVSNLHALFDTPKWIGPGDQELVSHQVEEPDVLRATRTQLTRLVPGLIRTTARAIARQSQLLRAIARVAVSDIRVREALAILATLEVDPSAPSRVPKLRALLDALLQEMDSASAPELRPRRSNSAKGQGGFQAASPLEEQVGTDDATFPAASFRRSGHTRAGGLLFLLHIVRELGLAETLCEEESVLAHRSLRWTLHQIARCLLPLEPQDAAALAFAGLAPDAEPPDQMDEPPSEPEQQAIAVAADAIVARLRERVGQPEEPRPTLLLQICRRRAEIVADPAWLEVCLALDDVSTSIRRAGLDLDLGWLPWLGCVVRFRYA
jgi:hypothetical protein